MTLFLLHDCYTCKWEDKHECLVGKDLHGGPDLFEGTMSG